MIPASLDTARLAALEAGKAIMEVYASEDFHLEVKSDDSPLTRADKAAHVIIQKHLEQTNLPLLSEEGDLPAYQERKNWEWYWLIDPLDGTKEFIKRNGEFTVNIALMHQNKPVAGVVFAPVLNALYYGSTETGVFKEQDGKKSQLEALPTRQTLEDIKKMPLVRSTASRSHRTPETDDFLQQFSQVEEITMGSSLKFMLLAEGTADINPKFGPTMEWDTAASHAILNALNRSVYQLDLQSELVYNKPDLLNPSFIAI